jgi:hypothetical protein
LAIVHNAVVHIWVQVYIQIHFYNFAVPFGVLLKLEPLKVPS